MTKPAPLTPAECNLRGLEFVPMQVTVLQSTLFGKSTGDEFKAAFALWIASWQEIPAASLPNDEEMLAFLSRAKNWGKVRDRALHGWIECSDGRLYHPIMAEQALSAWDRRLEHQESNENKTSRQQRWRERCAQLSEQLRALGVTPPRGASLDTLQRLLVDAQASTQASTQASRRDGVEIGKTGTVEGQGQGQGQGQGVGAGSAPQAPTPAPPAQARSPAAGAAATPRGTRLTADWVLPKAWGDWALAEYPQWTADKVRREAAGFRDHWTSKTGKDATKLDWLATWRNWCRDPLAHRDDPKPPRNGAPAPADIATRDAEARQLLGFAPGSAPQEAIDA